MKCLNNDNFVLPWQLGLIKSSEVCTKHNCLFFSRPIYSKRICMRGIYFTTTILPKIAHICDSRLRWLINLLISFTLVASFASLPFPKHFLWENVGNEYLVKEHILKPVFVCLLRIKMPQATVCWMLQSYLLLYMNLRKALNDLC